MKDDNYTDNSTKELLDEYSRIFLARDKDSVHRVREIVEELKRRGATAQPVTPKRRANRRPGARREGDPIPDDVSPILKPRSPCS